MTREEAKELLQTTPIDIRSPRDDLNISDYFEALNMAIEALSQIEELQRKIDIDHADYINLWAENQRLKQERPKGRWIRTTRFLGDCSECGITASISCNFCPNCGADMRESEQE